MSVQALKSLAEQAVQANNGTAQLVTVNGKRYAIINVTQGGGLERIPRETQAKAQALAEQIIRPQEAAATLAGKTITYFDQTGAHYSDETEHAHTATPISQLELHRATDGLSGEYLASIPAEARQPEHQFTLTQKAVQDLNSSANRLLNDGRDPKELTVIEVERLLEIENLPEEFRTAIGHLIQGRQGSDKIPATNFWKAYNTAHWGDAFNTQHLATDEPQRANLFLTQGDLIGGYLGRLRDEHLEGITPSLQGAFKAALYEQLSRSNSYSVDYYSLNQIMATQRTAQHAWNALENLYPRVDSLALSRLTPGQYMVPLGSQPASLSPGLMAVPMDPVGTPTREEQVQLARDLGLLRGKSELEISALTPEQLADILSTDSLYQEATSLGLLRDYRAPTISRETLIDFLSEPRVRAAASNRLDSVPAAIDEVREALKAEHRLHEDKNDFESAKYIGLLPEDADFAIEQPKLQAIYSSENLRQRATQLHMTLEESRPLYPQIRHEVEKRKELERIQEELGINFATILPPSFPYASLSEVTPKQADELLLRYQLLTSSGGVALRSQEGYKTAEALQQISTEELGRLVQAALQKDPRLSEAEALHRGEVIQEVMQLGLAFKRDLDSMPTSDIELFLQKDSLIRAVATRGLMRSDEDLEALDEPQLKERLLQHAHFNEALTLGLLEGMTQEGIQKLTGEALETLLSRENLNAKAAQLGIDFPESLELHNLKEALYHHALLASAILAKRIGAEATVEDHTIQTLEAILEKDRWFVNAQAFGLIATDAVFDTATTPELRDLFLKPNLLARARALNIENPETLDPRNLDLAIVQATANRRELDRIFEKESLSLVGAIPTDFPEETKDFSPLQVREVLYRHALIQEGIKLNRLQHISNPEQALPNMSTEDLIRAVNTKAPHNSWHGGWLSFPDWWDYGWAQGRHKPPSPSLFAQQ